MEFCCVDSLWLVENQREVVQAAFLKTQRLRNFERNQGAERMIRKLLLATAVVAFSSLVAAPVSAQFGDGNSANNLFSQYTTPDGPNMTTAGMYPAPYDSPRLGAQSHYTYQPLMPHEMMYQHSRNYYNYYNTGGYMGGQNSLNKTSVRWQSGSNHMGPLPFSTGFGGFSYKLHDRIYDINGGGRGLHSGGRVRGGHRLRGGVGCADGSCNSGETVYTGDVYGEAYGGGCANGGCSASLNDGSIQR